MPCVDRKKRRQLQRVLRAAYHTALEEADALGAWDIRSVLDNVTTKPCPRCGGSGTFTSLHTWGPCWGCTDGTRVSLNKKQKATADKALAHHKEERRAFVTTRLTAAIDEALAAGLATDDRVVVQMRRQLEHL